MSISSINPINGAIIKNYQADTANIIDHKIDHAHQAWLNYKETDFQARSGLLLQASSILTERKDQLAKLMALEMGKPLKAGVAEILKCASVCEYYAKNGSEFLADQMIKTEASKSYVSFQPIGVVLAIMPWNFPFWQVFRFLAPALMAGNAAVLKHSSGVTGCALEIEKIIEDAGFPPNIFRTLVCSSNAITKVIENSYIKAVTLTGSTEAGKKVAEQAGKLIKKTVLELGGSDPYIILEDADLERAAKICAEARLINNGQSCIAAKRFIVMASVEEKFTQLLKQKWNVKELAIH